MAVPSTHEIQEQIRQQQLVGMHHSSQQQTFPSMPPAGNYVPYVPQMSYPVPGVANNTNPRGIPVNVGKISLLAISFSLMLLGAFTFLGGFLLGIWVAGPRVSQSMGGYLPPQQTISYSHPGVTYPQEMGTQHVYKVEQNIGRHIGAATEAAIKEPEIHSVPE